MLLDFTLTLTLGTDARSRPLCGTRTHASLCHTYVLAFLPLFSQALLYNTEHTTARAHTLNAAHISVTVGGR